MQGFHKTFLNSLRQSSQCIMEGKARLGHKRKSSNTAKHEAKHRKTVEKTTCSQVKEQLSGLDSKSILLIEQRKQPSCLLFLKQNQTIAVQGKTQMQTLKGAVDILGFKIKPDSQNYQLFSPNASSLLTIKECSKGTEERQDVDTHSKRIIDLIGSQNALLKKTALGRADKASSVLLMNGLQMLESNFVCQYKEYEDIFAKDYKDNELRESEKHIHVVTSPCGYTLVEADDRYTVYKEPDEWINIITDIKQVLNTTSVSTGHKNPVVLICGGKGVGKSTFARFVMNSLLNSCSEVCYLECDVGQTELTPPTILSLNRVTTPSLGPPFTHLKWPERAYFYGDVSPKDNPDLYIKSISSLYRHYQEILTTTPLVINTQGWVKGLGIPLLMDVIRITNPTHIVQINSQQTTKNLPAITREFLDTSPGWVWPTNDDQQDPSSKTILGDLVNSLRQEGGAKCADADVSDLLSRDQQTYPTVYQIDACLEVDQKSGSAFRPSDHRTMNMLAYFSHVLESSTNITTTNSLSHCIPYRIPWSHVAIHVNHTKVPRSQMLVSLNSSIVGLAVSPPSIFETDDDDSEGFPKFLKETPIVECIGLGIVRNIDPINRLFYILTPVPLDKLQRVNTLLKGNLEIPAPVLIQDSHPSMPYVSSQFSYDIKGAGARKVRYNLQRKKFNSPGRPEL